MTDDNEVVELLKANLEAQNRTTHAVRAFVRFLFIQLVAVTIATPLTFFGFMTGEDGLGWLFLAFIVLVVGIIWSSTAGWAELGLSDRFREARARDRTARAQAAEFERQRREEARQAQRQKRSEEGKKLFASKRFRVGAAIGVSLVAMLLVIFVTVFLAQRTGLEALEETYAAALETCGESIGQGLITSELSERRDGLALQLLIPRNASISGDLSFVDCVSVELTGEGTGRLPGRSFLEQGGYLITLTTGANGSTISFQPLAAGQ